MPTILPVPSRGALRALRNLALGTSCTLALSAGLLTEDRRRRIHAAREVHDNAKKLKSSRKYHSTGTTSLEAFEDQLLRYQEDAFWLPSNVSRSKFPKALTERLANDSGKGRDPPRPVKSNSFPLRISKLGPKSSFLPIAKENKLPLDKGLPEPPKITKQQWHNRQAKLASDLTRLLSNPETVDDAALRFFETFEQGLSLEESGILPQLLQISIKLANACEAQRKFENSERVFDIILGLGTIEEENFYMFNPQAIIRRLIKRPLGADDNSLDLDKLRKACCIFLTKFREKSKTMPVAFHHLGERLCAETCRFGMYDLTLDIYSRLATRRGDAPPVAVDHLIIATHFKGHHKKVFRYFHKYYTQTTPDQVQFFKVGSLAIESILKTGTKDNAEAALNAACQIAEKNRISASTTWFLKVLGNCWRTSLDLEQTRALFSRLQPLLRFTQHPKGAYGAMIQFCVEANEESVAHSYYAAMRESYAAEPGDVRIYGHFAFAKAMRSDWLGVEEDFRNMKDQSSGSEHVSELGASFVPILKLFVTSHSVSESEEFIRRYLDGQLIQLSSYMMNIMVDTYGNAKEFDSLGRWIEYATSVGCEICSVTFNTILNRCWRTWDFTFWELFQLYLAVRRLGPGHSGFIDDDTVPILRQSAISGNPDQEELSRRLRVLRTLANRKSKEHLESKDVLRAMASTLARENPIATLKIYRRAQEDQVLIESRHLECAVKASLHLHGSNLGETLRHIQDAKRSGVDVSRATASIIIHQMTSMFEGGNTGSREVTELAQTTIDTFEKSGLQVPVVVVTHAASILERRGHYRLCIDVWESLSRRLKLPPASFDLVSLTVLLKAYIGLLDPRGIQWVVQMLSANNLAPDSRFRLILKNARRTTRNLLSSNQYSNNMHAFLDAVVEAIETAYLMSAAAQADKEEVQFKTIKIIEKAIADQGAREETGSSNSCEANVKELHVAGTHLKASPIGSDEAWAQSEGKRGLAAGMLVRRLVEAAAG